MISQHRRDVEKDLTWGITDRRYHDCEWLTTVTRTDLAVHCTHCLMRALEPTDREIYHSGFSGAYVAEETLHCPKDCPDFEKREILR
jgi:hypothetical protein